MRVGEDHRPPRAERVLGLTPRCGRRVAPSRTATPARLPHRTRSGPRCRGRAGMGPEAPCSASRSPSIALRVLDDNVPAAAGRRRPLTICSAGSSRSPCSRSRRTGSPALARAKACWLLVLGVFGIATGIDAVYYTRELGLAAATSAACSRSPPGWRDRLGVVTLWRTRARTRWRYPRRARRARGVAAFSLRRGPRRHRLRHHEHRARGRAADQLGVAYEDVTFETEDGLKLEGLVHPVAQRRRGDRRSRAARAAAQARMLARHGYGVLLFDRRGEGASEGQPNAFGWGGDATSSRRRVPAATRRRRSGGSAASACRSAAS